MMKTQFFSTKICCLSTLLALQILGIQPINAQSITASPDGTGTLLQQSGNQTLITGGSRSIDGSNLFHSFQQFNVDAGQVANFLANPGTQNILGRVTGGSPSLINGMLQVTGSNANLFLMNPSGMIFGANASLNVPASFTATTANGVQFSNGWWGTETTAAQMTNLLGNPTGFGFNTSGTILNAGNLTVAEGAQITLLGGTVVNTGTIEAPGGKVTIAAIPSEKLVRITPDGGLLSIDLPMGDRSALQSSQSGTPASLAELLTGQDSNQTGISVNNGQATLTKSGETVETQSGSVTIGGSLSVAANSAKNAAVHVLGEKVAIHQATIDASGNQGAGSVKIGGDYQGKGTIPTAKSTTLKNSSVSANSNLQGDGGQIIIWSNENTEVQAKLSAKGGTQSGNGGLVETSSAKVLKTAGTTVDASASQGKAGTWLLDPTDLEVVNGPAGANQVSADTIASTLDTGTSVAIDTSSGVGGNGDITFTGNVNQTGSGNAGLSFTGRRMVNNGGRINLTSTGGLTFNLNAVNAEAIAPTSSIQAAHDVIGNVNGTTTLNLMAGRYEGSTLFLDKNLTLNGAGPSGTQLSGQNARQVVTIGSNATAITFTNLAVQNGSSVDGAGINTSGNLTINNVTVSNNTAQGSGGGIRVNTGGSLTSIDSTISNNSAINDGGGIFAQDTVSLQGSTVSNNQVGGRGAGLFVEQGANIRSSVITNNRATNNGGGVFANTSANLTLANSQVTNNTTQAQGGGIYNSTTNSTIDNSNVENNRAVGDGGGIYNEAIATLNLTQSQVSDNTSDSRGGGIFNRGVANVIGNGVNRNSAVNGGGIFNNDAATLDLRNSSVNENQTTQNGAGLYANGTISVALTEFRNNNAQQEGGGIYHNTSNSTIDNASIRNNRADEGGGIYNTAIGTLNLTQSQVSDNTAAIRGGGISNRGTANVHGNGVNGNSAQNGGGIFNDSAATLSLRSSSVNRNQASQRGGGLYTDGTVAIALTEFLTNTAQQEGGGIYNNTNNATIDNTNLQGNQAENGGGLFNTVNGNIRLTTGQIQENQARQNGGGINNEGILSLNNIQLTNNRAVDNGGGVFNEDGANLTATNSQFIGNQARYGGGVATKGNTSIDNSTFRFNTTRSIGDDGVDGGAIRVETNGRLTLTNSLIENNTARFGGGLEASDNSVVSISNSLFRGNEATRSGGAIQNDDLAQMTIDQTTIDNNRVLERGGGGIENKARLTVTNSTLSNNQAITTGGGISQNTPTDPSDPVELNLTNVTISGNQAAMGGGVRVETGTATIASTTIANNTATQSGGGIYEDGGAVNVRNTLIATNNSPTGTDVNGTFTDLGNNLIGNNTGSTGFTNSQYVGTAANPINPLIAPLGNYGGNTQTHALLPGSRALDSGNTGAAPATDQRGVSRVNNADIGAFESRGFIITAKDGTPQTTNINTSFAQPIGVTVTSIGGEPVDGGQVTFTAPSTGASTTAPGSTPVTIAGGRASLPVAANSTVGQYQVTATGNGIANPETFDLSNVNPTPIPAPTPPVPTPPAPTTNPPIVTPDASPTEPTPTIQPAQEPIKFVAAKCDADGINDRKKNGNDDWVLRIANRSQVAKLLNAGDITGALQTLDLMTSRKGASGTQINPQMLDTGCPQSNLKDLAQQTRSGLIYTFVQDGHLDVILVSAGGPPVHKRMANISTVELQKLTQTLQKNPTAPTSLAAAQQLYQWLINPLLPELKAQAIDALFFSMDESLKDLPIAKLHDGKQYLESQYAIKAIGDRNTPQQLSQKN